MRLKIIFIFLIVALIASCTPGAAEPELSAQAQTDAAVEPKPSVLLVQPTRAVEAAVDVEAPSHLPPPVVMVEVDEQPPANIAPVELPTEPETPLYKVIDVANDDVLNVRGGPGIDNPIVGQLTYNATRIQISGAGELVGNYEWVPIVTTETAGWVNSVYLAQMSTADLFCLSDNSKALVDSIRMAVSSQDSELLATMVHPDGLTIGLSWWNPQVAFTNNQVSDLFNMQDSYEWGTETGSGREITGSFSSEVMPHLKEDLLAASQMGCNELLAGPTAGIVQLPKEYNGTTFITLHRPAPENGIIFDWGSWVIGLEETNGRLYVRYLMHIEYEI